MGHRRGRRPGRAVSFFPARSRRPRGRPGVAAGAGRGNEAGGLLGTCSAWSWQPCWSSLRLGARGRCHASRPWACGPSPRLPDSLRGRPRETASSLPPDPGGPRARVRLATARPSAPGSPRSSVCTAWARVRGCRPGCRTRLLPWPGGVLLHDGRPARRRWPASGGHLRARRRRGRPVADRRRGDRAPGEPAVLGAGPWVSHASRPRSPWCRPTPDHPNRGVDRRPTATAVPGGLRRGRPARAVRFGGVTEGRRPSISAVRRGSATTRSPSAR